MRLYPLSRFGFRLLSCGLLGLAACDQAAPPVQVREVPACPGHAAALQPQPAKPTTLSPVQTAVNFFAWYKRHRAQINNLPLLADADTAGNYIVDSTQTARFLALLRGSGYVSPAYLNSWNQHFRQWGDSLLLHPINEGPAAGFDYELVLSSQEGDHYLEQMAKVPKKVTRPAMDRAVVTAVFPAAPLIIDNKVFYLRRYTSEWLIDSIRR